MKHLFSSNTLFEYLSKFKHYSKLYYKEAVKKAYSKLNEIRPFTSTAWPLRSKSSRNLLLPDRLGVLFFRCNICGKECKTRVTNLKREEPSCHNCGSTVRMRAMIHILSMELFGKSLNIGDFPFRPDIAGIGMSDWKGYAVPLAEKLDYRNTFYHQKPKLDITVIDPVLEGTFDFIISSDVFEHIEPPVSRAFENARRLLKQGGVLIFSVPYTKDDGTKEHFPDLNTYEIIKKENEFILINISKHGVEQKFNNLVFHGGHGSTLELRIFSESSLMREFRDAGFGNVRIYNEPCYEFGIVWEHDWSLPIAARIT